MGDRVADLVAAFRVAPVRGGESTEKIEILRALEPLADPEVSGFLGEVAGDAEEYDLARIEAIRILELRPFENGESREAVARTLKRVLANDSDDEVRAYAARALASFTDLPGVASTAGALVLDRDEDADVRHNAFFALERSTPTAEVVELVRRCLGDDEFSAGAQRVLGGWMTSCRVTCRGYLEGVDLAQVDLQSLAGRILTGEVTREEFHVEIHRGGTLIGEVHAAPLYPGEPSGGAATAWCVTFSEPNTEGRWCLALPSSPGSYAWHVYCGGEVEMLDACAVPLLTALEAIHLCCSESGRARGLRWVPTVEAMNL